MIQQFIEWNMSDEFLKMILEELKKINEDRATPDFFSWYRRLKTITDCLYFEYSAEENDELKQKLHNAKQTLGNQDNRANLLNLRANIGIIEDELGEIQRIILVDLNKHNRIFHRSPYNTWQEELKGDFK